MIGGPIGWPIGGFIAVDTVTPPTPPVVVTTRADPGGHRKRRLELLQELDRDQRQRELDRRIEALEAERSAAEQAESEQRSPDEHQEPSPPSQPDQPEPELSPSPLPMVANFGAGPVTIGIKQFPSLKDEILADDEDAIIAIILAAQ